MRWYSWKWRRFAGSRAMSLCESVTDCDGDWRHVAFGLFFLVKKSEAQQ